MPSHPQSHPFLTVVQKRDLTAYIIRQIKQQAETYRKSKSYHLIDELQFQLYRLERFGRGEFLHAGV